MTIAARIVLAIVRAYQLVGSPFFGGHCRFVPSCSAYARDAVVRFGAVRGGWLALRRIARCHPWGGAGYDPVPERSSPWTRSLSSEHDDDIGIDEHRGPAGQ